jgi:DNA topoisomerase I
VSADPARTLRPMLPPPFACAIAGARVTLLDVNHGSPPAKTRLRRSDPSAPGYTRVRRAHGFAYRDSSGSPVADLQTLARIHALVIPPAWRDVWICRDPLGHLQATGVDAAGRRQYLYHEFWREQQDHLKFEHMEHFARALPEMRESLLATMGHGRELDRGRVLACAIRLLDVGMFRVGSDVYEKEDGHLGLSTIAKSNVSVTADGIVFDFVAKEGEPPRVSWRRLLLSALCCSGLLVLDG